MTYVIELDDGTEVELPNDVFLRIKFETAKMMVNIARNETLDAETRLEFVRAAKLSLNSVENVFCNELQR